MTGTDGLLYCLLKCKQRTSTLSACTCACACEALFIYLFSSLLSLGLLIALVAGTLPRLRRWEMKRRGKEERKEKQREKKAVEKNAGHQVLITGCLRFNRQRHGIFDGKRGDSLHECGHSYDRRGKKNRAQHHLHIYTLA